MGAQGSTQPGELDAAVCVDRSPTGGDAAMVRRSTSSASMSSSQRHRKRFDAVLSCEPIEKRDLADLTWSGVPNGLSRAEVWQMLLGYRPLAQGRRAEALQRKREEYIDLRRSIYDASPAVAEAARTQGEYRPASNDEEGGLLKQIRKDLPRTRLRAEDSCAEKLVEDPRIQGLMERVLFVWAVKNPASGYVQGMNDVILPLMMVAFMDKAGQPLSDLQPAMLEKLTQDTLADVEADCYWCISKILSEIVDHYTHGQPGIQRMVHRLKDIILRIDQPLAHHLEAECIDLFTTALRWITCLMVRELPIMSCIRLWDTLISESAAQAMGGQHHRVGHAAAGNAGGGSAGFEGLLVYFCACFTAYFSEKLRDMDFEAITLFFQKMPTDIFTEGEVEVLLSEAYVLKQLFEQAPKHLGGAKEPCPGMPPN
eukprot:TRINITY_DN28275_c0_g1_i1.p1 TRINITY_DN28275_c0_g1~~TRINITY_DN28275_c0_g1_i1.p1  ORF type:complete len:426 (+),score=96.63 TRINITY_DN28275_c0_g1_i1:133-1410(+)